MDLFTQLSKFLPFRTHVLIAVSGGLDSMVLLDILQYTNLYLSVIHANFQLRNKDSKKDEFFVKNLCRKKKILFYKREFSLKKIKSIQEQARGLRYGWFLKKLKNLYATYIILGHQFNDTIETIFINLFRSCSLRGLLGISEISKYFLRPLIGFTKINILHFAKIYNLWWREDLSNKENKYLRNSIRNELMTHFFSNFIFFLLKNDYFIINKSYRYIFYIITINYVHNLFCWNLNLSKIKKLKNPNPYIKGLFITYGINKILFLEKNFHFLNGKYSFYKKYKFLYDRNRMIISSQQEKHNRFYFLHIEINDFMNQKSLISVDYESISFPIYLRYRRKNDFILNKKISKLFNNYKINFFEKEEILLLINSNNKVIWVINFIINTNFRLTLKTTIIVNIF